MSDTPKNSDSTEATEAAAAEAAAAEAAAAEATGQAGASDDAGKASVDTWAGLPEEFAWVKDKVSSANDEAARYRTQLREAQAKLAEAKTPEEFEAARTELTKRNAELELELVRTRVSRDHGLTAEDMEILDGITDPAALEAKAEKLAARVKKDPAPPVEKKGDLRAGRGNQAPGDAPKEEDGREAWRNFRSRR